MQDCLKNTWIIFTLGCLFAFILSLIPFDRMQRAYMNEFHRLRNEPQRRIEATYQYLEALEDGNTNVSVEDFYKKLQAESKPNTASRRIKIARKYSKPLYVRDKNNPRVLHPYREKRRFKFW